MKLFATSIAILTCLCGNLYAYDTVLASRNEREYPDADKVYSGYPVTFVNSFGHLSLEDPSDYSDYDNLETDKEPSTYYPFKFMSDYENDRRVEEYGKQIADELGHAFDTRCEFIKIPVMGWLLRTYTASRRLEFVCEKKIELKAFVFSILKTPERCTNCGDFSDVEYVIAKQTLRYMEQTGRHVIHVARYYKAEVTGDLDESASMVILYTGADIGPTLMDLKKEEFPSKFRLNGLCNDLAGSIARYESAGRDVVFANIERAGIVKFRYVLYVNPFPIRDKDPNEEETPKVDSSKEKEEPPSETVDSDTEENCRYIDINTGELAYEDGPSVRPFVECLPSNRYCGKTDSLGRKIVEDPNAPKKGRTF
jgi:hypothetical protein